MTIEESIRSMYGEEAAKCYADEKRGDIETFGYIPFNGWNCEDLEDNYCFGWDGDSHRCDCGNRRVSWDFFDGHLTADAY